MSKNRNNKTESIRLPIRVVDFLRDMSKARGMDVSEMITDVCGQWIEQEKLVRGL